jgi:subtilisin family serine protease
MNSDMDRPGARHGRRFVATLALSLLACSGMSITPGLAFGANVGRDVAARVAASTAEIPVVITLNAQVARDGVRRRPADLLRSLRSTAERSQVSVRAELRGPSHSFWLVNAISTSVNAGELQALRSDPAVASITMDPVVTVAGAPAGTGPASWGIGAVNAPEVWSRYGLTGTGMRVGSIDTGVDPTNPELAGAIAGWKDFVGGRATPYDDNGHGTHTVGTMVARNVTGAPIGVAPGATVIVAKAMGADGSATGSTLLAAAQWMTDPDGNPATADFPTVINNSWTATGANNEWFRPMVQAWVAMGIAPVFAAGNTPGSIGNPASYPESIAVGQLEQSGTIAVNSSRGLVSWTAPDGTTSQVSKPDLTAPGALISSTVGSGYGLYSGSSMASPHVAAAIALIRQARPDLTVDGVREILRTSANDRGAPGPDLDYGAGALDVAAAIAATGAPVVGPTGPAPAQPVVARAAPKPKTTRIRGLRVVRRGANLIVQGRTTGPWRLRLAIRARGTGRQTLQPRATGQRALATAIPATRMRNGTFRFKVPVKRLQRRVYLLTVTASNASGEQLGSTTVAVRLR